MYGFGCFLRGRLREAVRFVCKQEIEENFQPEKLELDKTVMINETNTYLLAGKKPQEKHSCFFYVGGILKNVYFNSC